MFEIIRGTSGNDRLQADPVNDSFIFGGEGRDRILGQAGDDNINGEIGDDKARGGDGDDTLFGGPDDDTLFGDRGDDFASGDAGDDLLVGNAGEDTLAGGKGSDTLDGGGGSDDLSGGEGQDFITTGAGMDRVSFSENALDRVDPDPGARSVVGGEDFITDFSIGRDIFELDATEFDVFGPLQFQNALAEDLVDDGSNVIVLQNADDDGDPNTAFNAGSAANLIAEQVDTPGAGFFVYFNSGLNLNRLVYSQDLSDANADLQIVSRLTDKTGEDAIAALEDFSARDFEFVEEQAPLEEDVEAAVLPDQAGSETLELF